MLYFFSLLIVSPEEWRWVLIYSGYFSAISLAITLALTPLKMIFSNYKIFHMLNRYRREFGVSAFSYALIHVASLVVKKGSFLGLLHYIWRRPHLSVVWVGFPILLILAITSNRKSILKLGYSTWNRLHQNVYWVEGAVILHMILLRRKEYVWQIFGVVLAIQIIRLGLSIAKILKK